MLLLSLLKDFGSFLWGNAQSFLAAFVMLLLGIVFLPESVVYWLLRKLKPDITLKSKLMAKVREAINILVGETSVTLIGEENVVARARIEKIEHLVSERKKLNENLFFYELLRNLSSMLCYILPTQGYPIDDSMALIESSMSYLTNYSHKIEDTNTFKNEKRELSLVADVLRASIEEVSSSVAKGLVFDDDFKLTVLKMNANQFDSFMNDRWRSQRDAWIRVSKELGSLLESHVGS